MTTARFDYNRTARKNMLSALTEAVGAEAATVLTNLAFRSLDQRRAASAEELIKMADYLMELGNLVRGAARSQKVEAVTYRALFAAVD
ncbi:hypothetical protein Acy02nite_02880 [Actinoplanes cyaneus]|uniref:Uncharacterized protein n=1 Tax=Actinoplanes cyaneus TaxID=52696 RepID=A0A919M1H4_9ACTN|nr:hypothetical protein [Actinoplanes cyaneus]MCW2136223.1 hypothetical protein [Actinoplanes cyaneus]GID62407.1 hypothetical protein Acy02nite_02880 [Actinoplanes cyaneus]